MTRHDGEPEALSGTRLAHFEMSLSRPAMIQRDIFHELFVLELANNHWGSLERGLKIVKDFATVVRYNNVRAAIKLQFRDG